MKDRVLKEMTWNAEEEIASSITVLVTDPDVMTARLLATDLRRQKQFEVIDCASTAHAIQQCIAERSPAILLLGLHHRFVPVEWLTLLRNIRSLHPNTRTIVLLERQERQLVPELFRAGIRGVFERGSYDPVCLSHCIECVANGQIWAKSELLGLVMDAFVKTAPLRVVSATGEDLLTPRERDVVRFVAEGFGNREVAQQLGLSSHTVKNYMFNIFEKLGISSRAELILYVLSSKEGFMQAAPPPSNTINTVLRHPA